MQPLASFVCTAVAVSCLAAQTSLTVPGDAVGRDGLGLGHFAGAAQSRRQQFVLGESLLPGLRGRQITGLAFRRDGQPVAFGSGQAAVRVLIAQGSLTDSWKATPSFESNLGATPILVFQGQVSVPSSPRPSHRNAVGFGASEVIQITFAEPFVYTGGTLCIDIAGTPVLGSALRAWPIDVDRDTVRGQVVIFGQSCVQIPEAAARHVGADSWALRVGSSLRVRGFARPGDPAVLMLAGERLASAINLGFLGSPNCDLWVLPQGMLWTMAQATTPGFPGAANVYLHVPHDGIFLGAALHAQWFIVQGTDLRTSEGITLNLAASLARIDAAIVLSAPSQSPTPPSVGEVHVSQVPVMQIHYR